ncbi:hypothetical protein DPMN_040990 [Dreissena polymorpha]|uniref:Uncharacterized protein n=1 Tax=Dreissena polymorpha TaxID=45954 RepID=A0A9D4CW13_DREPO|nr:hypothetical protein DPMN_040990 [Dreissena polymorpha]
MSSVECRATFSRHSSDILSTPNTTPDKSLNVSKCNGDSLATRPIVEKETRRGRKTTAVHTREAQRRLTTASLDIARLPGPLLRQTRMRIYTPPRYPNRRAPAREHKIRMHLHQPKLKAGVRAGYGKRPDSRGAPGSFYCPM